MWNKCRRNAGVSIAELLLVVGILAILTVVSMPALVHYRDRLRQQELDEKAKSIFVMAQNRMAAMKLEGERPDGGLDFPDGYMPSDFPDGGASDHFQTPDSYVISPAPGNSGADCFSWMDNTVLAPDLVASGGGRYVIEYNSRTWMVYAVFYWEPAGGAFRKDSIFNYAEHYDKYDDKPLRGTEKDRMENRSLVSVGYYGGEAGVRLDYKEMKYQLSVINGPELTVQITMPKDFYESSVFELELSSATDRSNPAKYRFLMQNGNVTETDPESIEIMGRKAAAYPIMPGDAALAGYTLVLDSLLDGLHFADNYPLIAAGDDLKLTVRGGSTDSSAVYLPEEKSASVNSLFAGLRGADGSAGTVYLENGRHLQNLSWEVSGLGYRETEHGYQKGTDQPVRAARLLQSINWNEECYGEGKSYDSECTVRKNGPIRTGNVNFFPISNDTTDLAVFDGNGKEITGLHVTQSGEFADGGDNVLAFGMFGYMKAKTADSDQSGMIRNVKLINPRIIPTEDSIPEAADASYSGALAGILEGMEVSGCQAYAADPAETDKKPWNYYEKETSGVHSFRNGSRSDYAGGLIGSGRDVKAEASFASLAVHGKTVSGGFAGILSGNSMLERCYSGGHTKDGSYQEEVVNVQSDGVSGGFVGQVGVDSVKISRSFSACSVKGHTGGTFLGSGMQNPDWKFCYGVGMVWLPAGKVANPACASVDETALLDPARGGAHRLTAAKTSPYDEFLLKQADAVFPYPVWLDSYVGDWTEASAAGFVYYEKYSDGSWGFWQRIGTGDKERVIDSLRQDLPVVSDGYGYLGDKPERTIQASLSVNNGGHAVKSKAMIEIEEPVMIGGEHAYLYVLPWDGITHKANSVFNHQKNGRNLEFYDQLIIFEEKKTPLANVFYNPHFAKAISNADAEVPENGQAVIRTARQLFELGFDYQAAGDKKGSNRTYWKAATWSFIQERDVDYACYNAQATYGTGSGAPGTGALTQMRIGTAAQPFSKTYHGNGHEIRNLRMIQTGDNNDPLALFGHIGSAGQGILDHIVLKNAQITAKNAAALVGVNEGLVDSVQVINPCVISMMEGGSAAGLVSENRGVIKDSYCVAERKDWVNSTERYSHEYRTDPDTGETVLAVSNYTHAFIAGVSRASGFVTNNSGRIESCGSAAAVTSGHYDEDHAHENGQGAARADSGSAAGFVCSNQNGGRIENSYANCYVGGYLAAAGFVNDTASGSSIARSYALRRVTGSEAGSAAGFATNDTPGTISDSYAAVSCGLLDFSAEQPYLAEKDGLIHYSGSFYSGGGTLAGRLFPFSGQEQTNCRYLVWEQNAGAGGWNGCTKKTYDELCSDKITGMESGTMETTHVFSPFLPNVYPFPKAPGVIQYGDWPGFE